MDDSFSFANKTLLELLTATGQNARLWQESFVVGEAELWGRIREASVTGHEGRFLASVRVDLYTDRNKTHTVTDGAAGIALSPEAAIQSAVERYVDGTLRAFRAMTDASASPRDLPFAYLEIPQAGMTPPSSERWECFYGDLLTTGPAEKELREALRLNSPVIPLKDALVSCLREAGNRLHWVKILAVRRADGLVIPECAFDNTALSAGADTLRRFAGWPAMPKMQSFRQFIVFQPQAHQGAITGDGALRQPMPKPLSPSNSAENR